MTHFGYFLLILQAIVAVQSLTSYVVIYVQPPSVTNISAVCWTNASNSFVGGPRNFTTNGEFAWKVPSAYQVESYDAYWCRATMGNNILTKFSVFGDGLPRNSTEWLINTIGKRRIALENEKTNDYMSVWSNY